MKSFLIAIKYLFLTFFPCLLISQKYIRKDFDSKVIKFYPPLVNGNNKINLGFNKYKYCGIEKSNVEYQLLIEDNCLKIKITMTEEEACNDFSKASGSIKETLYTPDPNWVIQEFSCHGSGRFMHSTFINEPDTIPKKINNGSDIEVYLNRGGHIGSDVYITIKINYICVKVIPLQEIIKNIGDETEPIIDTFLNRFPRVNINFDSFLKEPLTLHRGGPNSHDMNFNNKHLNEFLIINNLNNNELKFSNKENLFSHLKQNTAYYANNANHTFPLEADDKPSQVGLKYVWGGGRNGYIREYQCNCLYHSQGCENYRKGYNSLKLACDTCSSMHLISKNTCINLCKYSHDTICYCLDSLDQRYFSNCFPLCDSLNNLTTRNFYTYWYGMDCSGLIFNIFDKNIRLDSTLAKDIIKPSVLRRAVRKFQGLEKKEVKIKTFTNQSPILKDGDLVYFWLEKNNIKDDVHHIGIIWYYLGKPYIIQSQGKCGVSGPGVNVKLFENYDENIRNLNAKQVKSNQKRLSWGITRIDSIYNEAQIEIIFSFTNNNFFNGIKRIWSDTLFFPIQEFVNISKENFSSTYTVIYNLVQPIQGFKKIIENYKYETTYIGKIVNNNLKFSISTVLTHFNTEYYDINNTIVKNELYNNSTLHELNNIKIPFINLSTKTSPMTPKSNNYSSNYTFKILK